MPMLAGESILTETQLIFSVTATRTTKKLRIAFLKHALRQEVGFFDSAQSGSISSSITTSVNLVHQGIAEKLGLTIQAMSTFIAAFIIAFAVQWKLTLIIFCIVPTNLVITAICVGIDIKNENSLMAVFAEASKLAEDIFSSIRTVHAFWAFNKLYDKYGGLLEKARKVGLKKSPNYAVLFSAEFFCVFAGYGLAFWQGIHLYQRGDIPQPGTIVTYVLAENIPPREPS
jgi:ATP-binding cassette, subfamily B (MDR/TAP), member 1